MAGRYWISGVQLGMLKGLLYGLDLVENKDNKRTAVQVDKLIDTVLEKQFIGKRKDLKRIMKGGKPAGIKVSKELIEQIAKVIHEVYQKEAHRQKDVRHPEKYEDLPENIKEYDRVLAKQILIWIDSAVGQAIDMTIVKMNKTVIPELKKLGDKIKLLKWN